MANKLHWEKWYHGDWLRESSIGRCSLAARGLWIELLSLMFQEGVSMISGSPEELSRIARCSRDDFMTALEELGRFKVADVTLGYENVTVTCRKIEKARRTRELTAKRVRKLRGNASCNAAVTGEKTEDRRQKTENTPQSPPRGAVADASADATLDDWIFPEGWDCPELRKALDDFAAMRRRIRKPIRSRASTSKLFKRFDTVQHLIDVAEMCEANQWQGLDPAYAKRGVSGSQSASSKVDGTIQAMRQFAGGQP